MQRFGELSPEDVRRAITLASELSEEDTERHSLVRAAEELGIRSEYVALAAARILASNIASAEKQRKRFEVLVAVASLVIAVSGAWMLRIATASASSSPAVIKRVAVTSPHLTSSVLTPVIDPLPVSNTAPIVAQADNIDEDYPTTITFNNQSGGPVDIYEIDTMGNKKLRVTVPHGQSQAVDVAFGHPILVTDPDGVSEGLYYPSGLPSMTEIYPRGMGAQTLNPTRLAGYLQPLDHMASAPASAKGIVTAIQLLNMSGEIVDVYRLQSDGKRSWVKQLRDSESVYSQTWLDDRWIVVSSDHKLVRIFAPDPVPRAGVVLGDGGR